MQCHGVRVSDASLSSSHGDTAPIKTEKEAIHSGHFMVSHFEAEAQDDEYEVAVPVPETRDLDPNVPETSQLQVFNVNKTCLAMLQGQLAIETSLTKLFQCMSLAYRQKLTSPKWNRFKGIRLRWKDKIRLNNVIWRCWHMQFIKKENTLICQFASPLDEGTHNKPEPIPVDRDISVSAVVLEGKYWKRKLAAVTAEYKKWRMFYRNKIMGWACKDSAVTDADVFEWQNQRTEVSQLGPMMVDEDYMELMSDTLFSTISSNQPFAFPDTREIARGANLADFIQPSLVQLQPNLEDFMDTLEPLQELFSSKLPPVPEDCAVPDITYRTSQNFVEMNVETQAPIVQIPERLDGNFRALDQTEALGFRDITQTAAVYQPVINYGEQPAEAIATDAAKMEQFYHPKVKPQQIVYPTGVAGLTSQTFVNPELRPAEKPASEIGISVVNDSLAFESDNSRSQQEKTLITPPQSSVNHQTFKLSVSSQKMQQAYKFHQYQKIPSFSSPHFSRISNEPSSLSDVPPQTEHHLPGLRSRHRTRSGSSLVSAKTRNAPPPLTSANSDTALNIPSVLLAHLLTNNSGIHNIRHTTDRFYPAQTAAKSANVPILPMPLKTQEPAKLLPKPNQNTLMINSTAISSQNLINTTRQVSSPDSPKDSRGIQNVPSPGNLSQSPTSPLMFPGSLSPSKINKYDGTKMSPGINEHRRVCHINAEQKRRYNIKNGFDVLHSLIPHLQQNPNVKLSKAAMLQKGAEYIRQLQAERLQAKEDMEALRCQIESLSTSINNCQSLLPATGAPVSRHRTTKMREMFDEYVRVRTMENWKFWIFSILFEPLLHSFSCSVSTASYDDLYRSTLIWVEQHCSLVDLRPAVLNSLRNLCTSTDILSDPSKLPEEARAAVSKKNM